MKVINQGFFSIFIGFLLIFQAYFVNILNLKEQVLSITLSRILTDLSSFKVSAFVGGGLLELLFMLLWPFIFKYWFLLYCCSLDIVRFPSYQSIFNL